MTTPRAERARDVHLQWCKDRAMEYCNRGDLVQAVTSMCSDLNKHEETKQDPKGALAPLFFLALMQAQQGDADGVERYIRGFR